MRHLFKTKYFQIPALLTYPYNTLPGAINRPVKEVCRNSFTFMTEAPPHGGFMGKGCDLLTSTALQLQGSDLHTSPQIVFTAMLLYNTDRNTVQEEVNSFTQVKVFIKNIYFYKY